MMNNTPRILFLSHGGGPLPLLGDESHREMVECLENIAARIARPSAIVVISAHWEEGMVAITSGAKPALIYDYYGFPEESYRIEYPCPGEPVLAGQIHRLLQEAGIPSTLDGRRGFDHGLFVPLKIMYPEADIPCVQISLLGSLDPAAHLHLGEALRGLRHDNLLVIGSGFSFHNMRAFFSQETQEAKSMNESFESWLLETCCRAEMEEAERRQRLIEWTRAPAARFCHPREEHLLPLHVCCGLAYTGCTEAFELRILNKKSSMYLW